MRKRRPTKNGQTVAKLKQLPPPLATPFLQQLLLGGFFCWGEKEREIYALVSGELAEEKEEGEKKKEEEEGKL